MKGIKKKFMSRHERDKEKIYVTYYGCLPDACYDAFGGDICIGSSAAYIGINSQHYDLGDRDG